MQYKYFVGQLLFFGFCYATTYVSSFVFPGGMHANGEFPVSGAHVASLARSFASSPFPSSPAPASASLQEMGYLPFGDHYLERGGDPHNVPAHVYDHIKDQLPEGHEANIIASPHKINDVTFASYGKEELPEGFRKVKSELIPPFNLIHGILGTAKEPSARPGEHWYSHPVYRGVKIVGGLPQGDASA